MTDEKNWDTWGWLGLQFSMWNFIKDIWFTLLEDYCLCCGAQIWTQDMDKTDARICQIFNKLKIWMWHRHDVHAQTQRQLTHSNVEPESLDKISGSSKRILAIILLRDLFICIGCYIDFFKCSKCTLTCRYVQQTES